MATRAGHIEPPQSEHERAALLETPVRSALRLSARTDACLERLGILTVRDLVRHFPYRYDDLRTPTPIGQLASNGTNATAEGSSAEHNALGTVMHCKHIRLRGRIRAKTTATIEDGTGTLHAVWYGRPYLANQLAVGTRVFVRGRVDRTLTGASMNVSRHRVLKPDERFRGELVPVYPQTAGLSGYELRRLIKAALRLVAADKDAKAALDPLPASINRAERFGDAWRALLTIHDPATPEAAAEARRRLVYEEFFLLAIAAARRRAERTGEAAPDFSKLLVKGEKQTFRAELARALPFTLTGAQERVIGEVAADLRCSCPMNRLLQGDVGSGKTAVAVAAMLLAARAGYQCAFMAPTEVLAAQQFNRITGMLSPAGHSCALLIGSLKRRTRDNILEQLRCGDLQVVVGTHALITEDVEFARLGLVIIDEQHRFGVLQRAALRAKARGHSPHTLVMTATPIPRTLAQTVYADLDVSVLDELPPGRTPIKTFVRGEDAKEKVLAFVRSEVEQGRQAFIVCPAIDESERALHSAVKQAQELRTSAFAGLQVQLLHGRMSSSQKDDVMKLFADGFVKILIATSLVEVGVDIPGASVMVVLDAHAFGLAQLHQLRGRVGRGRHQSYCILVTRTQEDAERLQVLVRTNDGFAIADEDLKQRGSGDLAGTRQHGGHELRLAHLLHDYPVFLKAKKAADAIVRDDPTLVHAENGGLAAYLAAHDRDAALRLTS
jgi:ATP-dependent DNA helicase RecG